MSDSPDSPSTPPPGSPKNGGNQRGDNRGGSRPNRRRFAPRGNGQPKKENGDAEGGQPKNPAAQAAVEKPGGANPSGQRGQNRPDGGHSGRRDRSLPDRDRGPRRSNSPGQQQPLVGGGPLAQAIRQAGQEFDPNRPDELNRSKDGAGRPDRRSPRNGGAHNRGQGRPGAANGQNPRGSGGENPGQPREANRPPGAQRGRALVQQQRTRPGEKGRNGNNRPAGQGRRGEPGKIQVVAPGAGARKPRKPGNRPGDAGENNLDYFKPPPIKTSAGIKSRSQEGAFTLSWWAARWIAAMENLVDGRRLGRGRSYAKDGQVLSIEEKPGGVTAQVQGSRVKPYRVAIEVIPLADFEWEKVFDVLASQALFAAQLLAGEMPRNIEEAFEAAGTSLFPARLGDLHTDCTCPDWANPCKHVAATHYILAERFDEDPFLLFRLRGRTSEQILAALRERRAGSAEEALPEAPPVEEIQPVPPLPADGASFYRLGRSLDDFALTFKEPVIEMAVLKRLGDPNFLGQESLLATLEPVYRAVRAAALEAALGEANGEEEENKGAPGEG